MNQSAIHSIIISDMLKKDIESTVHVHVSLKTITIKNRKIN